MELYILDQQFRRIHVIDKFKSLVWTERWQQVGDFVLDTESTVRDRSWLRPGNFLSILESNRVMQVETVEEKLDANGGLVLQAKGRSLEFAILGARVLANADFTNSPILFRNQPYDVVRNMVWRILRDLNLSPNDAFPNLTLTSGPFPLGDIPFPQRTIRWKVDGPTQLLTAIEEVCKLYSMGYRILREVDGYDLYFNVYTGNNRTTQQTKHEPVLFSSKLHNLRSTTHFQTIEGYANVAYVFSENVGVEKVAQNVDPNVSGYRRRVVATTAQIEQGETDIPDALDDQGEKALYSTRAEELFDGELGEHVEYTYGVHYGLGDLVEMRDTDGVTTRQRVTEQIFVADAEGDRSYPTLSKGEVSSLDTWLSRAGDTDTPDPDVATGGSWAAETTDTWKDL